MHISVSSWLTAQSGVDSFSEHNCLIMKMSQSKFNTFGFISSILHCFLPARLWALVSHLCWSMRANVEYSANNQQRNGTMLIRKYSTFRITHYEDIHLKGLGGDCQECYSYSLWTKTNQPLGDWHAFIEHSHCSQVIQGLIKALMTHAARCNIPHRLNWLDTPPVSGQLLARTPTARVIRRWGWAAIKKRHLFEVNSVLQVAHNVSGTGFYKAVNGTVML